MSMTDKRHKAASLSMVSEAIFDRVDFSLRKSVTSIEGEQKTLRLQEKTVESVL
jgi:hypothetical protein